MKFVRFVVSLRFKNIIRNMILLAIIRKWFHYQTNTDLSFKSVIQGQLYKIKACIHLLTMFFFDIEYLVVGR